MSLSFKLPPTIWEGSIFSRHSLGTTNREFLLALLDLDHEWNVSLACDQPDETLEDRTLDFLRTKLFSDPREALVTSRLQFPPLLNKPLRGLAAANIPWEFGAIPKDWIDPIQNNLEELWVPSSWVKDCYVKAGIDQNKIFVIPSGFNPKKFSKNAAPFNLHTEKNFKFLFVGGTIARKGADLLLEAYLEEFTHDEDVSLVIKDFGGNTFYAGQGLASNIVEAVNSADAPQIIYLTESLTDDEVPGLYTGADCLVHPYRGEGFGLPIIEAMACAKPVIVTNYGACLDFVNIDNGYFIDSKLQKFSEAKVGDLETTSLPWWAEPNKASLRKQMRYVFENQLEAKKVGNAAAKHVHSHFTWQAGAVKLAERLVELGEKAKGSPSFTISFIDIAAHYLNNKSSAIAAGFSEHAVNQFNSVEAYTAKSEVLIQIGQWDEADKLHQEALQKFPDNEELNLRYGYVALHTQHEDDALQPLLKAWEHQGNLKDKIKDNLLLLRDFYNCKADWLKRRKKLVSKHPEIKAAKASAQKIAAALTKFGVAIEDKEPVGASLSVCMITKDETKFIAQALKSVQPFVDEIIIVDTGSTDDTIEIAKKYGAKVFHTAWENDFAKARNVSLHHATSDWVLWLDADETVEKSSWPAIEQAIMRPQFGGYMFPIVNYLEADNARSVYTHRPCRLFRRLTCAKFEGAIHEQIIPSLDDAGVKIVTLTGAYLHHYGYQQEVIQEKGKFERTVQMLELERVKHPDDWFHIFNLANTYYTGGDYAKSSEEFEKVSKKKDMQPDYAISVYHMWASAELGLGNPQKALEISEEALRKGYHAAPLYYTRAVALMNVSRNEEAFESVRKAKELGWSDETMGDHSMITYKGDLVAGQALIGLGRVDEAEVYLRSALKLSPNNARVLYTLGSLLGTTSRLGEAEQLLIRCSKDAELGLIATETLAQMLTKAGLYSKASNYWGELCNKVEKTEEAWQKWFYFAEKVSDWQQMAAACEWKCKRGELTSRGYINWGRALHNLGKIPEALDKFTKAIHLDNTDPNAFFNAGDALYKLGAYTEAANTYRVGLSLNPHFSEGWFVLGNALYQMNELTGAQMAYKQAIEIFPEHTRAAQNLNQVQRELMQTAS